MGIVKKVGDFGWEITKDLRNLEEFSVFVFWGESLELSPLFTIMALFYILGGRGHLWQHPVWMSMPGFLVCSAREKVSKLNILIIGICYFPRGFFGVSTRLSHMLPTIGGQLIDQTLTVREARAGVITNPFIMGSDLELPPGF